MTLTGIRAGPVSWCSVRRSSRVVIWRELRRVQPVHLFVEPGPKGSALLTEHLGVALEAVLIVHRVQRIMPREGCRRCVFLEKFFDPRQLATIAVRTGTMVGIFSGLKRPRVLILFELQSLRRAA